MARHNPHIAAVQIVRDAGGEIVGRTRLQKVAYLRQLAGFGDLFSFEYHHYGPYSEDLARGISIASAFGDIREEERVAEWGGKYSVYRTLDGVVDQNPQLQNFLRYAAQIDAVELELAATAAFLSESEHVGDPWDETRRRKPDKARDGRLERAQAAYQRLRAYPVPRPLPDLRA